MPTRFLTVASVILALSSCGEDSTTVGVTTEALADLGDPLPDGLWPRVGSKNPIHVCFRQVSVSTPSPTYAADKATAMQVISETWEASSAIDFIDKGDCPAGATNSLWMPIELKFDAAWPNRGPEGVGQGYANRRLDGCFDCQATVSYGSNHKEFEGSIVHEVGHAIGFSHEFERPDFSSCWNLVNSTSFTSAPRDGVRVVTKTVDLASIMGFWNCYASRRDDDGINFYELSYNDRNGVQFLYPTSFSRSRGSVAGRYGFEFSDRVVVRSDDVLRTDWTKLNADDSLFKTIPVWGVCPSGNCASGGWNYLSTQIETPLGGSFPNNAVLVYYTDRWDRFHIGTDWVQTSSSLHAAVVATINQL